MRQAALAVVALTLLAMCYFILAPSQQRSQAILSIDTTLTPVANSAISADVTELTHEPSSLQPVLPSVGYPVDRFRVQTSSNAPRCPSGQPNQTDIEYYAKCPLPGLNNLLYSQINRWYCAYRDGTDLELRDRSCTRNSTAQSEPFRFSTFLTVDHSSKNSKKASICWSDISSKGQRLPRKCEWKHIPSFYGTALWWEARALIDFHPQYYEIARHYIHNLFLGEPFIAIHLRRGDYFTHCKYIVGKEPPWVSFSKSVSLVGEPFRSCYPTMEDIVTVIAKAKEATGLKLVLIATNHPSEMKEVARQVAGTVLFDDTRLRDLSAPHPSLRDLDRTIVEMTMLSMGKHFIFNKYSSFSGTVYEQARIHGRVDTDDANVAVW